MREDIKTVTIFGLTVLVGLLIFVSIYFIRVSTDTKNELNDAKRAAVIVKLNGQATAPEVIDLFNSRIKFPDKNDTTVVWVLQGQMVDEDELFLSYGIVKPKEKEKARTALFKGGAKRFVRSCNQLYGPKDAWSLGYCTLEPFPKEQVA